VGACGGRTLSIGPGRHLCAALGPTAIPLRKASVSCSLQDAQHVEARTVTSTSAISSGVVIRYIAQDSALTAASNKLLRSRKRPAAVCSFATRRVFGMSLLSPDTVGAAA